MHAKQKMAFRLTKTNYLSYLKCRQEFWLEFHQPVLFHRPPSLESDHLYRQGNEVQKLVRHLAHFQTAGDRVVDFERTFQTEQFSARSDVVITDKATNAIEIYEIKGSSKVKDEHYDDIAFQRLVAEMCGAPVSRCHVVTMNPDYVRRGEIDPEQLFVITDVTAEVAARMEVTGRNASGALEYLKTDIQPSLLDYAKSKHRRKQDFDCLAVKMYFPSLPAYSVFNVPRIHPPKLIDLVEMGIVDMFDIPDSFDLSEKQRKYITAARSGEIVIERDEIVRKMSEWEYPLHFLDYETFLYAIPQFDGVKPFQQMCFQYSLHTIDHPEAEPRHTAEYLARNGEDNPPLALARHLKDAMSGGIGTVFVWYEDFEKVRNEEMARMFPEFRDFFDEVNAKTVDLMKLFSDRLYIHPGFKGRSSIKKVLPVLCPHLDYGALGISEGMTASISWFRAVKWDTMTETERLTIFQNLLEYCALDTFAMVEIYRVLRAL